MNWFANKFLKQFFLVVVTALTTTITYADKVNYKKSVTVYKKPACGCCGEWVNHIKAAGFITKIEHPQDLSHIKNLLGIKPLYHACHTAVKKGFFFEGHIPAEVIAHFLRKKPNNALGLSVPGMPLGSPGMDATGHYHSYEVLQIHKDGSSKPYAKVSNGDIMYLEDVS